ncbi:MAG: CopG family transcriptional regulator [Sulfolobales archaeon]
MAREKSSEVSISVTLDVEVIDALDEMARERGVSRSFIIKEIIYEYLGMKKDGEPQLELNVEGVSTADILLDKSDKYRWLRLTLIELYPEVSSVLEKKCPYCGRRFRARSYMARHIARGVGQCPKIYMARAREAIEVYREFISMVRRETIYRRGRQVEVYVIPNPSCPRNRKCREKIFGDLGEAIKYFVSKKKARETRRRQGTAREIKGYIIDRASE